MSLFAELDADSRVLRVVVCESLEWLQARAPGTWMEVAETDGAGPGLIYAGGRFLREWMQPEDEELAYAVGAIVWHAGGAWQSDVDGNMDEPGGAGWTQL